MTKRAANRMPHISAELMAHLPPLPEPGPLATIDDLQVEWQRIHRGRNRKQLTPEEYTNLMYGLQSGLAVTRARDELKQVREELRQRDRIAEALEQQHLRGGLPLQSLPSSSLPAIAFGSSSEPTAMTDSDKPLKSEDME